MKIGRRAFGYGGKDSEDFDFVTFGRHVSLPTS